MGLLKKIGQALVKGAAVGTEIMQFPFVTSILQGISLKIGGKTGEAIATGVSDFNTLTSIAVMMESAFPTAGSGSQRLAASIPAVSGSVQLWAASNLPGHNKLKASPEKFAADIAKLQSAWVDVVQDFGD